MMPFGGYQPSEILLYDDTSVLYFKGAYQPKTAEYPQGVRPYGRAVSVYQIYPYLSI